MLILAWNHATIKKSSYFKILLLKYYFFTMGGWQSLYHSRLACFIWHFLIPIETETGPEPETERGPVYIWL